MSAVRRFADRVLRVPATAAHAVLKAWWFVRRPKSFGAHAIALTPQDKLILVRLRYASGWRVPGGGRSREEDPARAALRELREEIGMISHGEVTPVGDFEEGTDYKRGTASLVLVRDVRYRPARWNWEVEQIREVDPGVLPDDMSPLTAYWIKALLPLV